MTKFVATCLNKCKPSRMWIMYVLGAFPGIFAYALMYITTWATPPHSELVKYLIQNQDDIFKILIVSSIVIVVHSTLLRNMALTFLFGAQTMIIQMMDVLKDISGNSILIIFAIVMIVLPFMILSMTLVKNISRITDHQGK